MKRSPLNTSILNRVTIPKEKLIALYCVEGMTEEQIAHLYQCSVTTVINRMKEYGIRRRPRPKERVQFDLPYAIRLYKDGLSVNKISRRLGVSDTTIAKRLKETGATRD